MAYDLLFNQNKYAEYYTQERLVEFKHYMEEQLVKIDEIEDIGMLGKMFLELYANPVIAKSNNEIE
jgi:hypothetical protein